MTNESPISEREREILRLVATGATNQQIAVALNISVNTVKVHLRNIFAKIGVESRTEATVYAIRAGIVSVGETGMADAVESTPESDAPASPITPSAPPSLPDDRLPEAPVAASAPDVTPVAAPGSEPIAQPALFRSRFVPWLIGLIGLIALVAIIAFSLRLLSAPPTVTSATPATLEGAVQRWFTRQPLSEPRDDFALTGYDLEQRLYVIGGRRAGIASAAVDRYDPETDRWVRVTDKPTAVSHAGAITLRGLIFVPGGELADGQVSDQLEIYDPREQRWFRGQSLPAPRSRYALAAWEGQLYLIGGWDGSSIRAEVFVYDPVLDRWESGPPLPQARRNAGVTVASGRLYITGGEGEHGPLRDSAWLEPGANPARRWIAIAPLPQPIARPVVVGLSNTLLVFDSERREGLTYDVAADAWSRAPLPPEATIFAPGVLLNASIYFVGDSRAQGVLSEYRALYVIFIPGQ